MESSLSTLLAFASTLAYLDWREQPWRAIRAALLSMLLGLAVLARTENLLLVLAIGLHAIASRPRDFLRFLGPALLPFVGLVGPWMVWQWTTFGTLEQSSGIATRLFRIYGNLDIGGVSRWNPTVFVRQSKVVLEWLHRCALAQEYEPLRGFGLVFFILSARSSRSSSRVGSTH